MPLQQGTVNSVIKKMNCKRTLGYNEPILSQSGHFSAQINPVITNTYGRSRAVFFITEFDNCIKIKKN